MTRHLNFSARDKAKNDLKTMCPEKYREQTVMNYDFPSKFNAGPVKSQDVLKTVKSELYRENDNHPDDIEDIKLEMLKNISESE